ncbi:16030_t:CDS:1, partial [Acaulospora colombiana]
MANVFSRKKLTTLDIILDDDFDGIMYGLPEESLGCRLKGKVVLRNSKALSVRYLVFMFLGKISVACGPAMSASRVD